MCGRKTKNEKEKRSEEFGKEILVTYLRKDESESDAILRAMEIYDPKYDFYVKETFRS
jgi:hypothetical protein